ncbi:MAG TPA: glycosyltransferase [Verrucomicrobiae bacterium]|nr:glycosyltransferase [Verrucomicrobiae bacterium]
MKTVLILTASFADRYAVAARNLSDALEAKCAEAKVEVADLFQPASGSFKSVAQKAYSGLMRIAPTWWAGINGSVDRQTLGESGCFRVSRLQRALGHVLQEAQPDLVVSTYPAYAMLIHDLYQDHAERPFRLISVVTDSGTIQPGWLAGASDWFSVSSEAVAEQLRAQSIPEDRIKVHGFPVSVLSSELRKESCPAPQSDGPYRILFHVESGSKKVAKSLKRLLDREENHVTVVVDCNAYLKADLAKKLKQYGERVQVLGWTNRMPQLLRSHHLVIGKAGSAVAEEAIAAGCPMIANQRVNDQEYVHTLINNAEIGAVACKPRQLAESVRYAFKHNAKVWKCWRSNLAQISRPNASLDIAQALLDECEIANSSHAVPEQRTAEHILANPAVQRGMTHHLLCDFHIHTNYSDGKLSVADVVDFYGVRHFDCICITDHLADSRRLIGKLGRLSRLTLSPNQLEEYFDVIDRQRRRAWRKYNMLVMTGLEFNKDGLTKKSSAHLLGIDLTAPIVDCLDLPETIAQIHAQGGLAVASHPHIMKSEWGKDTLYLWENQERFDPLIDAWEIANRNNMFNPVSAKRLPYLANSDFHKPKHIYSWKTLVSCEKEPEAIKECIRKNERIAITLYREADSAAAQLAAAVSPASASNVVPPRARGASPMLPAA